MKNTEIIALGNTVYHEYLGTPIVADKIFANLLTKFAQLLLAKADAEKADLIEKAQAVIDRWYVQNWKDASQMADYIDALRLAVAKAKNETK